MRSWGCHNRNVKYASFPLALALVLGGCAKNIDNKEAVQAGVKKYVAGKGINVDQMDVNVNTVTFHGTKAEAAVAFAPKGGGSGVATNYQLEREKDEWVVKSRSAMNTLDHTRGVPGNPDGTIGSKP